MTPPEPDIVSYPPQLQATANVVSIISRATGVTITDGVVIWDLPDTDPSVAGAPYNDSGTVKISAG
jgi:hypothetical protein